MEERDRERHRPLNARLSWLMTLANIRIPSPGLFQPVPTGSDGFNAATITTTSRILWTSPNWIWRSFTTTITTTTLSKPVFDENRVGAIEWCSSQLWDVVQKPFFQKNLHEDKLRQILRHQTPSLFQMSSTPKTGTSWTPILSPDTWKPPPPPPLPKHRPLPITIPKTSPQRQHHHHRSGFLKHEHQQQQSLKQQHLQSNAVFSLQQDWR